MLATWLILLYRNLLEWHHLTIFVHNITCNIGSQYWRFACCLPAMFVSIFCCLKSIDPCLNLQLGVYSSFCSWQTQSSLSLSPIYDIVSRQKGLTISESCEMRISDVLSLLQRWCYVFAGESFIKTVRDIFIRNFRDYYSASI